MRAILAAMLFVLATGATAEDYFVSTTGDNSNDCLSVATSCKTMQHTFDICPLSCSLTLAPGQYNQKLNAHYSKVFFIYGDVGPNGCNDRGSVLLSDLEMVNGTLQPVAGIVLQGQDGIILLVDCISIVLYAPGSTGFGMRQSKIGDVNNVNFYFYNKDAIGVSANEGSTKINIASPGIYGSASRFGYAGDMTQLSVGGHVVFGEGTVFDVAVFSVMYGSLLSYYPQSVSGNPAGDNYQCVDSMIKRWPSGLPGNGQIHPGSVACRLY